MKPESSELLTHPLPPFKNHSAAPAGPAFTLAIAATFTAEPIESILPFLLGQLGYDVEVRFADYHQVIPQLLDPTSLLGRNQGVNLVLVRFEDWARFRRAEEADEAIRGGVSELTAALGSFAHRRSTPTVVCICPPSSAFTNDPARRALIEEVDAKLQQEIRGMDSVQILGSESMEPYRVADSEDARLDRIGHVPYTSRFFTALGTALARRVHAIKSPAYKVIALDADNTLWQGVVGEDGPAGITIPAGKRFLQEFVVQRQSEGMLLCIVSKNAERDVLEVFESRPDMSLRREHLVSWRVNWQPKSRNLVELAGELNLGLDSFIFLDDNPVECAEVRGALPEVLTLEIPPDGELESFLRHVWAFDRLSVTEEDRKRTSLYRQNVERSRFEGDVDGIEAFLAGLELRVEIAPPSTEELPRVAQRTQRTNQFNFTTVRRSEAEVRSLAKAGLECLRACVADRFGDYGLVGVLIFGVTENAVVIDTALLSCRALGRGVEHAMLAHLGRIASERGKDWVDARFVSTAKNLPAANFLESVGASFRKEGSSGIEYRFPAEVAAALTYRPGADAQDQLEIAREKAPRTFVTAATGFEKSRAYQRFASELREVEAMHRALEAIQAGTRPDLGTPATAPRSDRERDLVAIWKRVLLLDEVGIDDDFFRLGGTSLKAASLFAGIEERFGTRLPMTTILESPTIAALADRIERGGQESLRTSLRVLKAGGEGPALFLIHDGDGETLLYANLARRMPEGLGVYGLEPLGTDRCPILHTRIPEMAAHYAKTIREVQPEGPYFLGGMCAGGTIAFETALQLNAQGQAIGLVALLDSVDPQAEPKVGLALSRRWSSFSRAAVQGGDRDPLMTRLARRAVTMGRKFRNLLVYETSARVRRYSDARQFRRLRRELDRGLSVPRGVENLSVRIVYTFAEKEYTPNEVARFPVVLFRATVGEGADEPFVNRYTDPHLGWGKRLQGELEVVDVEGGHASMLQDPNVARISDHLVSLMDRVIPVEAVQ